MKGEVKREWKIIDRQKVIDYYINQDGLSNPQIFYRTEYIIQNLKTGEVKRV